MSCDRRLTIVPVLALVLGAGLGGCNKAESKAPAAEAKTAAQPAAVAPDPAYLAEIKKKVEDAYKGNERPAPTGGKKPEKGKKVWIISPGMIGESSSIPVNAAK